MQEKVTRGRLDLFLTLEKTGDQKNLVKVDKEIGLAYYKALKELSSLCQIGEEINLAQLAQMPGVIMIEEEKEDLEAIWPGIEEAVIQACQELVTMRTGEGEKLALDLKNRGRDILDYVRQIEERSPLVVQEYQEKLTQRVQELLGEIQIDESKLASEVAFFADRASITEELVRLKSHLSQMNLFLDSNDAVGRKLDFLVQEMNREINTIGSKGNDLAINRVVVEVKSELEKVREQVQNLE